jgi:hypothetical protein
LQVQFEEMSGWSADSDAAAMLSNLGIGEESFYIDGRFRGKIKVRVLAQALLEIRFIDYG